MLRARRGWWTFCFTRASNVHDLGVAAMVTRSATLTNAARLWLVILIVTSLTTVCSSQAPPGALVQVNRVDYLDDTAREPSIVQHPSGALFVAGYGVGRGGETQKVPRLWKSTDEGATWKPVNVGGEQAGALANSDVSLAIAPDGTLYYASMQFDVKAGEGTHIVIGVSKDAGESWRWTMVSKNRFDDRPWVAVAPDGMAHVIWNDGIGVYHVSSRDQGTTWSERQMINPGGGSSFLAVGPKGQIAVRIVPPSASGNKYTEGADIIAMSTDGGNSWQKHAAPGKRDWVPMDMPGAIPRWVEPLAWDSQGALYSLWTNVKGVWLARSADSGITWKQYKVGDIDHLTYYPYLTARRAGELAATWFSGASESLRWKTARISISGDHLRVSESPELETEAWHVPEPANYAPVRSTAGEYLSAVFLQNGKIAIVSPIQDPAAKRFGFTFREFQ